MASNLPAHPMTGDAQSARVVKQARCADSSLDPDEWFPASIEPAKARHEAAAAIAVCTICLIRAQCLEFSLRDHRGPQHHRRFLDRAAVIALVPWRFDGTGDVQ